MAPTSKGTNPAPNYTVTMNRVQTQIEAQLRIVRSFMPSLPNTTSSTSTPQAAKSSTFSALASACKATPSFTSRQQQQAQKQDAETLFAETRAEDPNAGLGFGGSSKRNSEREKERENQMLRSRLLGRRRGVENAPGRTSRREESSDEEPGRSGLGRAKKRARREVSEEDEVPPPVTAPEAVESARPEKADPAEPKADGLKNGTAEEDDGDVDTRKDQEIALPQPIGSEDTSEQTKSKKRKRKKRRKNKSKEAGGE